MNNVRRFLEYASVAVVIILMAGFFAHGRLHPLSNYEQRVTTTFYCAGQVVNQHKDPYLTEPLRACENHYNLARKFPWVEPSPLPGYGLAVFGLLARLPFDIAKPLWFYLLIASVVVTAVILAKLIKVPVLLTLLCLALVDGYLNLSLGEPPPFAVLFLVFAAALGANKRYIPAAMCASLAMFEPHLALPACTAMFLWWSRTRVPFIITGLIFAGVSIVAIGLPANIEYLRAVLPVQALSEIAANDQYSLTRIVHLLGFSDKIALLAGSISYFCMFVIGILIAKRVAEVLLQPALVVLLPSALALLGGTFVHDVEMGAAIPAVLILATSTRFALWLRVGMVLALVIPWDNVNYYIQIGVLEVGAIIAGILIVVRNKPLNYRLVALCVGVVGSLAFAFILGKVPHTIVGPPPTITTMAIGPNDLVSANWAANVSRDVNYSTPHLNDVVGKSPTWLGLLMIAWIGIYLTWASLLHTWTKNLVKLKVRRI